ncbi:MAG: hypothetical protein Q9O74_03105 [Planctomycetota bacterium]|nr:hypothetical protein [Planctomycetota bacterium]
MTSLVLLRAVAVIWALLWTGALAAAVWGEPWRGWVIGAVLALGVWTLVAVARWKPRAGGLLMAAVGTWAGTFFNSQAAMIGLVAPAIAMGVGFLLLGLVQARRIRKARKAQTTHTAINADIVDAEPEPQR